MKAMDKLSRINVALALVTILYQGAFIALFLFMSGDTVEEARIGFLVLGFPGGLTYLAFLVGWWPFLLLWKGRSRKLFAENGIISLIGVLLNLSAMAFEFVIAYSVSMF
ncbi:MAG: hypothetical protein GY851_13645 [bacterium]|nr:hypothetical protein [bacterium]